MDTYKTTNHRPQDDLPYERQMFYIIRDYRRLTDLLRKVSSYAKKLEKELERAKDSCSKSAMANTRMSEKLIAIRKEVKRQNVEIEDLKRRLTSKFSMARCCVCGRQVKSGYIWDGKSVICSDKCGYAVFKGEEKSFDVLKEEGKRLVWHDDLLEV